MHKLVYLFELDSVRNSSREIEIGQRAIYEEIVKNGNYVVLTFNQLTDSSVFLSVIDNEDAYKSILKLFKIGVLRVSVFGRNRTASAYVQSAIEKCLDSDENAFLFSAVPVLQTDKDMLKKMLYALRYSDPSILEDDLREKRNSPQPCQDELERLEYLIRFIRLILFLSVENMATNPAKIELKHTLTQFLNQIMELYQSSKPQFIQNELLTKDICECLPHAVNLLQKTRSRLLKRGNGSQFIENRTNWINELNCCPCDDTVCLAEAIVDLCYNYTLEDSIQGAAKHYHNPELPFQADFENRLVLYWRNWKSGVHMFHQGDRDEIFHHDDIDLPAWNIAVRMIYPEKSLLGINKKRDHKRPVHKTKSTFYEEDFKQERSSWYGKIMKKMAFRFGVALMYMFVFCLVGWLMNQVEDEVMQIQFSTITASIIDIVCFGIISSLISNLMHLPDILQSVKEFCVNICDAYRIFKISGDDAYRNFIYIKRE